MKYQNLIGHINADINTNGNHAITGAKLNSALNEMVTVLGDGFRIAGRIYPDSDAPTDPENGMCYIAATSGLYVNFGNIEVNDNEIAFIYYDSDNESWSKMWWSRKDFGLVVVDASTSRSFGEDEMTEVRKSVCFIIRNDASDVPNRLFVKDRSANGFYWFYAAPMLIPDLAGDLVLDQGCIQIRSTAEGGRYPYETGSISYKLPTKGNLEYALSLKQDELTFDTIPVTGSDNPITSGGVKNAISGFIDNTVSNLVNYYTKSETYTKTEVTDLIAAIHAARFEVVQSLPVRGETNVIYLLPASSPTTGNVYNEYVWVNNAWELIGSTSLDLSNYYTKTQTDNLLLGKQNTLTFDTTPKSGSTNPVTSGGIKAAIDDVAKVPTGGTSGQVLTKRSEWPLDYGWEDPQGGGVTDVTVGGVSVVTQGVAAVPAIPDTTDFIQKSHTAGLVKNDGTIDTTNYGTYSKPSGGIPSTDIASGVIPTVPTISTDIKDDATSDTKTTSPKAVKDYVDGAVPTISTNITADATSDIKTASPKAVKTFVEGKGYGTYSKPSGGIPKTDLANAVQTSLGLADTAVQTETDPVFSASAAAGITSSDISDWDGKAEPTPVVDASTIPSSMEPNKLYKYGTLSGNTVFPPFATPTDQTIANVYWWKFTTPSTAPTITWPAAVTEWAGGQAPNIDASTTYEITVEDGFAAYIKS